MEGEHFWIFVDRHRPPEPDPEMHAWMLTQALIDAGAPAAVEFSRRFDEAMRALYTWDLWGAGHLLLGGLSDDGFEYLRAWIVGQGRSSWDAARTEPESYLVSLVAGIDDSHRLVDHLVDIGIGEGEPLLYAGARAHEHLTGRGSPEGGDPLLTEGPGGEPWELDDLPQRFTRLDAALPFAWTGVSADGADLVDLTGFDEALATFDLGERILDTAQRSDDAFAQGDHAQVVEILEPLLEDPDAWALMRRVDDLTVSQLLVYQGGMSKMICGDLDGAARWLRLVADDQDLQPSLVRGLAQLELALGNFDACEQMLRTAAGSGATDHAIATLAAGYRADRDLVLERTAATREALEVEAPALHPWDVAGVNLLLGTALVEVGEGASAAMAADNATVLIADAPPEVPLGAQALTVAAGAHRLLGDLDRAGLLLTAVWERLEPGTADLGAAQREAARCHLAAGDVDAARIRFEQAVATYRAAGQRWLAESTGQEADNLT